MEEGPASAHHTVAMETLAGPAAAAEKSDARWEPVQPQQLVQHQGQQQRAAAPFNRGSYYILIVIGEIATENQLTAIRESIELGESIRNLLSFLHNQELSGHVEALQPG
ncbi:UNVERIFIED_CONTAM: hypothetical protein FKN15_041788 [Acipenser sinensis]